MSWRLKGPHWLAGGGKSETCCLSGHVRFIDYEYSSYNYQAFDIGNHFNEFAGLWKLSVTGCCICLENLWEMCVCAYVCDQEWLSQITFSTRAGTCRWTGCTFTCRPIKCLPRRRRRSAPENWSRSMCKSTSLLWWAKTHTHTFQWRSHTHSLLLRLCLCRLHTSFGAFGLSSRPNTPRLTLTSWGESLCVCWWCACVRAYVWGDLEHDLPDGRTASMV